MFVSLNATEDWPFVIENFSDHTVTLSQKVRAYFHTRTTIHPSRIGDGERRKCSKQADVCREAQDCYLICLGLSLSP